MRPSRNKTPPDLQAQTHAIARRLAERLKMDIQNLRLIEVRYHDGRQWTIRTAWEQRIGDDWVEVDWTLIG